MQGKTGPQAPKRRPLAEIQPSRRSTRARVAPNRFDEVAETSAKVAAKQAYKTARKAALKEAGALERRLSGAASNRVTMMMVRTFAALAEW